MSKILYRFSNLSDIGKQILLQPKKKINNERLNDLNFDFVSFSVTGAYNIEFQCYLLLNSMLKLYKE